MQAAVSLPHSSLSAQLARRRRARAAARAEHASREERGADRETVVRTRPAETCERDSKHTPSRDRNHAQDGLEFNPPVFLDVRKACAGKKVLIMGLPGAFTPC